MTKGRRTVHTVTYEGVQFTDDLTHDTKTMENTKTEMLRLWICETEHNDYVYSPSRTAGKQRGSKLRETTR